MPGDIKGQIQPKGYIQCLNIYMDFLLTRKRVALFHDYKAAHDDVLMEMKNTYRDMEDAIQLIIDNFCEITDVKGWFDDL